MKLEIGAATLYQGDCLDVLRNLPDASVQCCVTSPPYFGLRDYGHAGQIGLEPTPDEYVAKLVEVFREVRRVLKKDGTCWLNLGDSYAGYHGNKNSEIPSSATNGWTNGTNENARTSTANRNGLKPKDLIGIPWRVAFALQADGWWLRQDCIWHKPNPMPESVRDRCTKAHEYLFLLSKADRYYFDADTIAEEASSAGKVAYNRGGVRDGMCNGYDGHRTRAGLSRKGVVAETRNRRSVWTIATKPYSGAHFATMPPALVEPCILAGSRPGDVVLDPFSGSGTTAAVAVSLGRRAIGIELNADYQTLAVNRITAAQTQTDLFRQAA